MYDIRQLEAEWKKYRNKKLRVWYIALIVLVLLGIVVIISINSAKTDFTTVKGYFQSSKDASTVRQQSNSRAVLDESGLQRTVLLDSPIEGLEVEDRVIEVQESAERKSPGIVVDVPILDDDTGPIETGAAGGRKKVHLEIIESTSASAYKDVENRFYKSEDINDALFLARTYYDSGNYKKAEQWALQANRLDESLEESLLLFVKSKVKLGNKNEGISILTSYLKRSNSEEAQKLLYQIENDKF
ncbi:MAG TPA: CDC27 family protein [Sulfurovum sp.]|uniref:CDC27 family protein n=1 Tax=Sulfurovum sp. TaxID=1969726 RepID=UPI002F95559C